MLIAISGSQGSGKSSVIRGLEDRGHKTIKAHVARSILKDWNLKLDTVNDSHELTIKFQDEVTKRKRKGEVLALKQSIRRAEDKREFSTAPVFTERTHADVFTYALIDLGRKNEFSDWVNQYYRTCLEYNQLYTHVYYLRAGRFTVENDGVRGYNPHYSKMVDNIMLDITREMILPSKLSIIEVGDLNQRLDIIEAQSGLR